MERLFDDNTDIIHQNPHLINQHYLIRKWILLPQIAHKVLIPYPKDKKLNLFEETMMKLFMAGKKTPSELAGKMMIEKELVVFIHENLLNNGYLDEDGLVTEEGTNALKFQNDFYDLKTGYVFYDLIGGFYWDSFVMDNELNIVESEQGWKVRPYDYGDIGDPRRNSAVVLFPDSEKYPQPEARNILEACIKYKIRMKNLELGNYSEVDNSIRLPNNLEKVKFLGDSIPLFVSTFIYFPEDVNNQSNWQICHPFYGGISVKLRDKLEKSMSKSHGHIKQLVEDMATEAFATSDVERKDINSSINKKAEKYLKGVLSDNVKDYPLIFKKLAGVYYLAGNLEKNRDKGSKIEENQKGIEEYLSLSYQALEDSLYILEKEYRDYYDLSILTDNYHNRSQILSSMAEKCGFQDDEVDPFFQYFFRVRIGALKHLGSESKDLRSLVAANLLIARENADHPFWELGENMPLLIKFFSNLTNKRNSYSHDSEELHIYSEVENVLPNILYIISVLLEDLSFDYEFIKNYHFESSEINRNLYIRAKTKILNDFGIGLRECEQIMDLLVQIEMDRLLCGKPDTDFSPMNTIIKCSKVMERVCAIIRNYLLLESGISKSKAKSELDKGLDYLAGRMKDYGFDFELDNLPDSFKNVPTRKIQKTFNRFDMGVLSTKLYVILYSSCTIDSKLISKIAENIPEFISVSADIKDKRGHGNKQIEEGELKKVISELYSVIKKLITIFRENSILT